MFKMNKFKKQTHENNSSNKSTVSLFSSILYIIAAIIWCISANINDYPLFYLPAGCFLISGISNTIAFFAKR